MKYLIRRIINKIFYRQKIKFYGKNNTFICPLSVNLKKINISIYGNNNTIIIGENAFINHTKIIIGFPNSKAKNCLVKIGQNSGLNSANIQLGESNSSVIIGKNCAFSYDIELNCTDQHSIFDKNNQILNIGKNITIGDHVWLCKEIRVMKNSKIPNGCIVAQGSIVTKKFDKENCVIAGNPAKIVKEDIYWAFDRPNEYVEK